MTLVVDATLKLCETSVKQVLITVIFFISALGTDNVTVKQQVYELLSALCVYSKDGYSRALETLENHKVRILLELY